MIRIGFWGSGGPGEMPDPRMAVDVFQDPIVRFVVAKYLDKGDVAAQYRGFSHCRICGVHNGSRDLTDGTFLWPSGLSHYVREHAVRLSDDFIAHAMRGGA